MKTSIALVVGVALGVGTMYLFGGKTECNQQLQPKFESSTTIRSAENIEVLNTKSGSTESLGEAKLIVPSSTKLSNQYSDLSVDEDRLRFVNEDADIEALKQEMLDSPENVRLRKLWDLNKEVIGWDDIERVAPNLPYEQKLNLESLLQDAPKDGLDILLFIATLPDSGSEERNSMYLGLNATSEISADHVFMVDSLIEDACGQQVSPRELKLFVNGQMNNIERAYQKRSLSELRRLINDNAVCSGI